MKDYLRISTYRESDVPHALNCKVCCGFGIMIVDGVTIALMPHAEAKKFPDAIPCPECGGEIEIGMSNQFDMSDWKVKKDDFR